MAGYSQSDLENALRAADAAGDTQAAQAIAAELANSGGGGGTATSQEASPSGGFDPLRSLDLLGTGAMKGLASLPGLPKSLLELGQAGGHAMGLNLPDVAGALPSWVPDMGDMSQHVEDWAKASGYQPPSNPAERMTEALGEGIGGSAPALLTGPFALPGIVGGMAGSSTAQGSKELGLPEPVQIAAGLGGGLLGGNLLSWLNTRNLAKTVSTAADDLTSSTKALRDLQQGQATDLAQHSVDESKGLRLADAQRAVDLGNAKTQGAAAIDSAAAPLGSSTNFEEGGKALQDSAKAWLDPKNPTGMNAMLSGIMDPLDKIADPKTTQITLGNLSGLAKSLATEAGPAQGINAIFAPSDAAKVWREVNQMGGADEPISLDNAKTLLRSIGSSIGRPDINSSLGEANARAMYGALQKDITQGILSQHGAPAADSYLSATDAARDVYSFANGPLASVVKGPTGAADEYLPGQMASRVIGAGSKDSSDLSALRQYLPSSAVDELAASAVREGKWSSLNRQSQEALVPDQATRSAISDAHSVGPTLESAAHQNYINTAEGFGAQRAALAENNVAIHRATQELSSKKDAFENLTSQLASAKGELTGGPNYLAGLEVSSILRDAGEALGVPHSAALLGGAGATFIPSIMRLAGRTVSNPLRLSTTLGSALGTAQEAGK